jgi:hypothetical protein
VTETGPKILTIDIETAPALAAVFGLFRQNISLPMLRESHRVISFAAKWHGKRGVEFHSEFHDGKEKMLERAHALLSEADIVVHYNGTSFDIPHLKREFWLANMEPPAPFLEVDLLKVIRKEFRFLSNKLDHVVSEKEIGKKVKHAGAELWIRCLLGEEKAWAEMRRYNKHDVVITEALYDDLGGWITGHPHMGHFAPNDGQMRCQRCASTNLRRKGYAYTQSRKYQRYQCRDCGKWNRSKTCIPNGTQPLGNVTYG